MKIIFKKIVDSTPSFEEYIEKKLSPIQKLVKNFEKENEIELLLDVVRTTKHHIKGDEIFMVQGSLQLNKKIVRAEEYASDARLAIDKFCDTLKVEINKYKNQLDELNKK
jgi:ribosomal subunit interface protein